MRYALLISAVVLIMHANHQVQAADANADLGNFSVVDSTTIDALNIIIPSPAYSQWDNIARLVGGSLLQSGSFKNINYQNIAGQRGNLGIEYLVDTPELHKNTLLINSTVMLIRALIGSASYDYLDLKPVASVVGDYYAILIPADAAAQNWDEFIALHANTEPIFGGVSVAGGLEHLALALILSKAQHPGAEYVTLNSARSALTAMLTGMVDAISIQFSEAIQLAKNYRTRILAITAPQRLSDWPDIPTFREQNVDAVFVNWQGFFAEQNFSEDIQQKLVSGLERLTPWPQQQHLQKFIISGDEFRLYLEQQEDDLFLLLKELGML